jgi:membrane-bound lytic murein transglycosylase B
VITTAAVAVGLLVPAVGGAAPVAAAPLPAGQSAPPGPAPVAQISPELARVRVSSPRYRAAEQHYDATAASLAGVFEAKLAADARLVELAADEAALTARIAAETQRKKAAGIELAEIREALRQLAVDSYIKGGRPIDDLTQAFDPSRVTELGADRVIVDTVHDDRTAAEHRTEAVYDAAVRAIDGAVAGRRAVRVDIADTTARRDAAAADEVRLTAELAARQVEVDQARATATVVGTDFALVALDAYHRAAVRLAETQPGCGITWWAIAGISRIEGRHGTYRGTELLADGQTTPHIIGIPLTGENGTRYIGDSDSGSIDGDAVYDRAVGPMQFIPTTWARWARDGNGDGVTDPHNLYDAALATASYLCAYAPLTDDEGLYRAYFGYNHADWYATAVLTYAHGYATLTLP